MRLFLCLAQTASALAMAAAAAAAAAAAMADAITIQSPQRGERGAWIAAQAEAAGQEVAILKAGGGELVDLLFAGRNNPQADVVFGLVNTPMAILAADGLFQPYTPTRARWSGRSGRPPSFWASTPTG